MKNDTHRSPSATFVLAVCCILVLMTHVVDALAENHPWTWWVWGSTVAIAALGTTVDVFRERRGRRL